MSATAGGSSSQPVRPKTPLWATLVATFSGIGLLRPGPGSWGSAATVVLWAGAAHCIPASWQTLATGLTVLFVVAIGIPAATEVARSRGLKDPQFVVIDEVAGQLITFLAVPLTWKSLLAGFILFRVFDILKPFPIRRLEQLPEGTGIVIDDVGAGIYALIVMHLLLHFGLLMK